MGKIKHDPLASRQILWTISHLVAQILTKRTLYDQQMSPKREKLGVVQIRE